MILKRFSHLLLVPALLASITLAPFQSAALAQAKPQAATTNASASSSDLASRLAAIEKAVEEKRKAYHIPGISLVIVKDDQVIYMKGLGLKNIERNLPVTPDTLFAIGSSSKAFTALAAAMSADDGKLSLDDSPRKYLPYFKLHDTETDARITIRDLLSHRSGLDRTDLSMVSGKLSREELIQVAGRAKPTAKLGEKFLYQNVMFAAAGEAVAKAQNTTWDKFIEKRIFKPLGMKASNTTVAETLKAKDYALGYTYNDATKETKHVPMREIIPAAPAGAINSTARDMAQWLRLMLGKGVFEGKRLVSEKSFNELISRQHKVTDKIGYGLGWFLRDWHGHKVVEHGGNIDGFNALVALMPDQKLGFVLLTNITGSPLGPFTMETIWSNLVGKPETNATASKAPAGDPALEVGKYLFTEAGMTLEVDLKDGKLLLNVPGQPIYTLEAVGARRYKLAGAPEGFFVTFRPVKDKETETEMYLEQPHGNYTLARVKADAATSSPKPEAPPSTAANYDGPLTELIASYELKGGGPVIEIAVKESKVSLVVPGQPAYPLVEREKDRLTSPVLPDTYSVSVKRDPAGKVSGIIIKQPEGEFEFTRAATAAAPASASLISVDELMAKVVAAHGGEENLRKHKSSMITIDMNFEHQGMTGTGTIFAKAPNALATIIDLMAVGKKVGTMYEYFDGTQGGEVSTFSPEEVKAGKSLEDARITSDFYEPLNWKKHFKSVEIKRMSKLGDEDVYVVVQTPEKGNVITDYYSARSYLLLRRDTTQTSNTSQISIPVTETYSDYRLVDGVMIPFKTVTNIMTIGDIVSTIKTIKFDVQIPDTAFKKP